MARCIQHLLVHFINLAAHASFCSAYVVPSDYDAVGTGVDGTMNDAGYPFCTHEMVKYLLHIDYTSTGFKHVVPKRYPVSTPFIFCFFEMALKFVVR